MEFESHSTDADKVFEEYDSNLLFGNGLYI